MNSSKDWKIATALRASLSGGLLCLLALGIVPQAHAQIATEAQKCINAYNKSAGKVAAAQGKKSQKCLKNFAKDKLTESAGACTEPNPGDPKDKADKAIQKMLDKVASRCSTNPEDPSFPPFAVGDATTAANVSADARRFLIEDLFGPDVNLEVGSSIFPAGSTATSEDKAKAKCQQKVLKAADKCWDKRDIQYLWNVVFITD